MIRFTVIAAIGVSIVLLAGCKKDIQNKEAVRQGVMSYLSKRSDLVAMDVSIASVSFHDDEATAQVHFQAKGNDSPAAGMTMQYVLERKDNQWVVKGRTGANAHGANMPGANQPGANQPGANQPGANQPGANQPGANPSQSSGPGPLDGMPRIPGASGGASGSLPPGHPAVGGSQALPPGHPAIPDSSQQK